MTIAARYVFRLPDLGEGITEAEVVTWLVSHGDQVQEDAYIAEVQTDKAVMELPSPVHGTVLETLAAAGETIRVGTPLIVLGLSEEAVRKASPAVREALMAGAGDGSSGVVASKQEVVGLPGTLDSGSGVGGLDGDGHTTARPLAPPVAPFVRRRAAELGVSLAGVVGSGADGRITEQDVRNAATLGVEAAGASMVGANDKPGGWHPSDRRVPLRGVRRLAAQRLVRAHREIPAVVVIEECDFTDIKRVRHSYLPLLVRAAVESLKEFPEFNASVEGEELIVHERFDIGIAVQTPDGLVVPVIRAADTLSLDGIAEETVRLSEAGRRRTLQPEAMRGSTFTISAAGGHGALLATPIVNHPEVAMLALHRVAKRPAVVGDHVAVRKLGLVSLTFDHRVADGIRATALLRAVIAGIGQVGKAGVASEAEGDATTGDTAEAGRV
jgi:pyruvate/2-oxoglutarate dehydrogenase complex dihydrolipoamide acyltransferase (E2) component